MYPILYEQISSGTVPADYGLGVLSDCISCVVEQERNGIYELTMEYPISGIHAKEIAYRRVLKVKPNFTDNPQLFRIDRIGKEMGGKFTVYAKHISYDLSGFPILTGSANNAVSACLLLEDATDGYVIDTDKEVSASFVIDEPASVRSFFAGKEGSFLDVFGTAEIKYDNFHVSFLLHAGQDRGVTIRYGKNLLELSQELEDSNLYTHVLCFYKNGDDEARIGNEVATGLSLDVKRVLILDVSSDYQEAPSVMELTAKARNYIALHNLTVPSNNITLDFLQSGELVDRVDLCDTVTIYYEALGISRANAKCIRTKWDCLKEKYIETEFGDVRQDLADTISESSAIADQAKSSADSAVNLVASKKRVFTNTPTPPYDVGDLWVDDGAIFVCNTARSASYIRLIGETTTEIEEGSTTGTIVVDGETYEAQEGDVVVYNGVPFVWIAVEDEEHSYSYLWTSYETRIYMDWELATNYIEQSIMDNAISEATDIITGTVGGLVILHSTNYDTENPETRAPNEIIITNDNDFHKNTAKLWRWNAGGLGYSKNGYDGEYQTAITIDENGNGQINASMITTGVLNASRVTIQDLKATMFTGKTIRLGGSDSSSLEVLDVSNNVLVRVDKNGLECFGESVNGIIPSVVFDKNGVTAYSNSEDKENTAIFWTKKDNFCMKNAIVENQIDVGKLLKFTPITIRDNNNNIINQGIAVVPLT